MWNVKKYLWTEYARVFIMCQKLNQLFFTVSLSLSLCYVLLKHIPNQTKTKPQKMSIVLRKLLELILKRNPTSSHEQQQQQEQVLPLPCGDMGELDQLPSDILVQILRLLGPKEVAKLSVICKSLKFSVSDNRLWLHFLQTHQSDPSWDSVFFAETNLTSGYPLPLVF